MVELPFWFAQVYLTLPYERQVRVNIDSLVLMLSTQCYDANTAHYA